MSLPARLAVVMVVAYQRAVAPFLPRSCRFAPTCSEYARLAVIDLGLVRGAALTAWRLLRCHPFHPGGYDPPPAGVR